MITGTWEEIAARAAEFRGRRVRLIVEAERDLESQHVDLSSFRGLLRLTEDPLDFQKRLRDEWQS